MCTREIFDNLFPIYLGKKHIPMQAVTHQSYICVKYFRRLLLVMCLDCADSVLSTSEVFHCGKKKKRKNKINKNSISSSEFNRLLLYSSVSQVHMSCLYVFLPDLPFYPNSLNWLWGKEKNNIWRNSLWPLKYNAIRVQLAYLKRNRRSLNKKMLWS